MSFTLGKSRTLVLTAKRSLVHNTDLWLLSKFPSQVDPSDGVRMFPCSPKTCLISGVGGLNTTSWPYVWMWVRMIVWPCDGLVNCPGCNLNLPVDSWHMLQCPPPPTPKGNKQKMMDIWMIINVMFNCMFALKYINFFFFNISILKLWSTLNFTARRSLVHWLIVWCPVFPICTLHVLLVHVWVSHRYSCFLPQSKRMPITDWVVYKCECDWSFVSVCGPMMSWWHHTIVYWQPESAPAVPQYCTGWKINEWRNFEVNWGKIRVIDLTCPNKAWGENIWI